MYQIGKVPANVWTIHNLIDSASRIAVPLFFMISGYFLLYANPTNKKDPLRDLPKRVVKILVPLVAWSIAYHFYSANAGGQPVNARFIVSSLGAMLQGAAVYHLWFLYELLAIYMLLPILRQLFSDHEKTAFYFVGLWIFFLTSRFLASLTAWSFPLANYLELGNTGYLVIGYLLRRHLHHPSAPIAAMAALCYGVAAATTYHFTEIYSLEAELYVETFHVYNTPNVIVMAVSAFIVLLFLGNLLSAQPWPAARRLVENLAACSFGIYFLHVLILERFHYNVLERSSESMSDAVVAIALTASVAIACGWLVTVCLRFSKFTRWLAP